MRRCRHNPGILSRSVMAAGIVTLLLVTCKSAQGGYIFVANDSTNTIGEYTTSGATVNASLVSGLSGPDWHRGFREGHLCREQLAWHDRRIHDLRGHGQRLARLGVERSRRASRCPGRTSLSRTCTWHDRRIHDLGGDGQRLARLGADRAGGIAVSGADIFVMNYGAGTIGEYTDLWGATVNASLVSGLSEAYGITVSRSKFFVPNLHWHRSANTRPRGPGSTPRSSRG